MAAAFFVFHYSFFTLKAQNVLRQKHIIIFLPLSDTLSAPVNVTCNGSSTGSDTVTAYNGLPPYTYSWSTSPVQTTSVATGLSAGKYTVTVIDALNTTFTASVTITQPMQLFAKIKNNSEVQCRGDSTASAVVIAAGGTMPYIFRWSNMPKDTDFVATGLSAGNYTVTVMDSCGATATATVTISQPPAELSLFVKVLVNVSCNGGYNGIAVASGTGGKNPYNFLWSNGDKTDTAYNLTAGNYTLTLMDFNGCIKTDSVTITQPSALNLVSANDTICAGDSAYIQVTSSGGFVPYTYLWNSGQTSSVIFIAPIDTTCYTVHVSDMNGCTSTVQSCVIVNPIPHVSVMTEDTSICFDSILYVLKGNPTGGTFSGSGVTGNTFNALSAGLGNYLITYTFTDNAGCTDTAVEHIKVIVCQGIDEKSSLVSYHWSVYPNPADKEFSVHMENSISLKSIEIYSISGQMVETINALSPSFTVNSSSLKDGIYFIKALLDDGSIAMNKVEVIH